MTVVEMNQKRVAAEVEAAAQLLRQHGWEVKPPEGRSRTDVGSPGHVRPNPLEDWGPANDPKTGRFVLSIGPDPAIPELGSDCVFYQDSFGDNRPRHVTQRAWQRWVEETGAIRRDTTKRVASSTPKKRRREPQAVV